jgi:hypothetical protein
MKKTRLTSVKNRTGCVVTHPINPSPPFFLRSCGVERKTSLARRCSTTRITPPAFSTLAIFEIGSHFMPGWAWTLVLLFELPHIAGMTGAHQHTQPWVEIGVLQTFGLDWPSNFAPSNLCLLRSEDYRFEPPCLAI